MILLDDNKFELDIISKINEGGYCCIVVNGIGLFGILIVYVFVKCECLFV